MGGPGCERPSKEHTARPWIALKTTSNVYPQLWPRFTFFDSRLIHFRFVPPPTCRSRSSSFEFVPNLDEDRDREKRMERFTLEIDRLEARPFRSLEFSRKFKGSGDQTSVESLVSHGTLLPPIATSRLSLSRPVLFLSREGGGGGSGVQRLNDRIPRPSNRVFAGSVCRLSTN